MIECATVVTNYQEFVLSYAENFLSIDFETNVHDSFVDEKDFGEFIELVEKNSIDFFMPGL